MGWGKWTSGVAGGRRSDRGGPAVSPIFDAVRGGGWRWSLANTPRLDGLSLEPAEPCA